MAKPLSKQQQAIVEMGKAFGLVLAAEPISATVPQQPKAAGQQVRYFTEAELAEGQGYPCTHPTKPCKRLLAGPNRTSQHRGRKGHTPTF